MFREAYQKLRQQMEAGGTTAVITRLTGTIKPSGKGTHFEKEVVRSDDLDHMKGFSEEERKALERAFNTGALTYQTDENGDGWVVEPCIPEPRLIVLGGGHVAKPVVEFGAKLGFRVTVVDDRLTFANPDRFPTADSVICESFHKCFEQLNINPSCYVVIVTRGHRHDMDCYRQILNFDPAYTGMIGSKRRLQGLKQQLLEEGASPEKLAQLHGPIGLDIGAVTPEEIALSILAEVVQCRRMGERNQGKKLENTELDRDVLLEMAEGTAEPRALVTILSTKGSVPRKAGAKMVIWPYGKTLGSIGGGCSESEVITLARDIIAQGGWHIHRVDMTGDVAESEGMVCGGIMDVLIEAVDWNPQS